MGGMFSVLKVQREQKRGDYSDPGCGSGIRTRDAGSQVDRCRASYAARANVRAVGQCLVSQPLSPINGPARLAQRLKCRCTKPIRAAGHGGMDNERPHGISGA